MSYGTFSFVPTYHFRARIEAAETLKMLPNSYNLATTFSAK